MGVFLGFLGFVDEAHSGLGTNKCSLKSVNPPRLIHRPFNRRIPEKHDVHL